MPRLNVLKKPVAGGIYHLYNRGNKKKEIFLDDGDYHYFVHVLREGLYEHNVRILAYCLMPNHFHLLVQQPEDNSIERLMRSVMMRYVIYFNRKYSRVGRLFESAYKSVPVLTDAQLIQVSAYIHRNPTALGVDLVAYGYSSLKQYDRPYSDWIDTKLVRDVTGKVDYVGLVRGDSSFEESPLYAN